MKEMGKYLHDFLNILRIETIYFRQLKQKDSLSPETVYPQRQFIPRDSLFPKTVYPQRQFIPKPVYPRDSLSPETVYPQSVYTWYKLFWG